MLERFSWRIDPLEEIRKFYLKSKEAYTFVEFTVAFPQSKTWLVKGSLEQIVEYERYVESCLKDYCMYLRKYDESIICSYTVAYEKHKNGSVHVHGILRVPRFKMCGNVYDFQVVDVSKFLCKKSKKLYDPKKYHSGFNRYCAPFCTVQMSDYKKKVVINEYEYDSRLCYWLEYITKSQTACIEDEKEDEKEEEITENVRFRKELFGIM